MKNKFTFVLVLALLVFIGLGCGISERVQKAVEDSTKSNGKPANSGSKDTASKDGEKSLEDKAIDTATGGETTGIPECDQVLAFFEKEVESQDDGYIEKATKSFFFNKIKEQIRADIEKNKSAKNDAELKKSCTQYLKELEKFKSEAPAKQ